MTAMPVLALPARYVSLNKSLDGGQGIVHLYHDTYLERMVAVKMLHNVADYDALLKEINARGKIKSKHVAEIFDCITDGSGKPHALILEYVPGDALFENGNHPAAIDGRHLLLYQLASGLAEIHAANVIHRDIKPSNMKVDGAGVLKIFDLGIANLDAVNAYTIGGAGTLVFGAPELYSSPTKLSAAADIYAIGVIAWKLYFDNYPAALLEVPPQTGTAVLPAIGSVVPELGAVGLLIDRALSITPSHRPSAIEFRDTLAEKLTFGRHRGVISLSGKSHELKAPGKGTNVTYGTVGQIGVMYDGARFIVKSAQGAVFVNNVAVTIGSDIPHCCVITIGDASLKNQRAFIPFNASHPEVVL
jgi:serine/threonine protein kinase